MRFGYSATAATAALAAAVATTTPAVGQVIFYEPFDFPTGVYPTGSLPEPNPNRVENMDVVPTLIAAGSLSNPWALPGSINRFSGLAPSFGLSTNFTYDNSANNTIWGSFLVQNVGSTNMPTGLDFSVNTTTANNQNIGVYFYTPFAGVGVNGILGTPAVSYRTDDQAQLFVFRADQNSFSLWVNPESANLGTPAYTTPIASIVRINSLRMAVAGANDLDEVRLGTSQSDVMIPTPAAAGLLALGGLMATRRRR